MRKDNYLDSFDSANAANMPSRCTPRSGARTPAFSILGNGCTEQHPPLFDSTRLIEAALANPTSQRLGVLGGLRSGRAAFRRNGGWNADYIAAMSKGRLGDVRFRPIADIRCTNLKSPGAH
jgi:hypothetical protein